MIEQHKRGDTFELPLIYEREVPGGGWQAIDLTGYTFRCQVRREGSGELVSTLDVVVNDAAQGLATAVATPAQTQTWPIGRLATDVESISPAGRKTSTDTVLIDVIPDVTRDD